MSFFVKHKVIIFITVFSLLASLAYSFWYRIDPVVDAEAYEQIAVHIIKEQTYPLFLTPPLFAPVRDMNIF
jgi:hypothetical protein